MTFFSFSDSAWSPWGCRVCRCVLWAGLWCTGRRWAAPSQPGRSQTSATSGLWFSLSWQSSLWPEEEKTHVWLCSSIKNTCYILDIASVDVMCDDSRSGGVSTDCDSTPDFLPAPGSAGLCPRSRAGPTESSASRSAKHTRIRTSPLEHDVQRTVQLESEKITLMMSSEISQFPDRYLWNSNGTKSFISCSLRQFSGRSISWTDIRFNWTLLCKIQSRLCSKRHLDIDLCLLLLLIKNRLLNVHFVSFGCFWFVLDLRLYFLCLTSFLRLWVSSGRYSHRW